MSNINQSMTPREIVQELDKHIIGQADAKRAVAIALRNRWRRSQVDEALRNEITPKNILMIGPTGVGKTEIARRVANIADAPFIKVEASKFTEVGYVGRDVESIIRDLVDIAIKQTRETEMRKVKRRAEDAAEERILDILLPPARGEESTDDESSTRQRFRKMLREGKLDDRDIDIEINMPAMGVEIMAPPGMEDMTNQLQSMFQNMSSSKTKSRRLPIKDAYKVLVDDEASKMMNDDEIKTEPYKARTKWHCILDEIDKICKSSERSSGDVLVKVCNVTCYRLVEGCTVTTNLA